MLWERVREGLLKEVTSVQNFNIGERGQEVPFSQRGQQVQSMTVWPSGVRAENKRNQP